MQYRFYLPWDGVDDADDVFPLANFKTGGNKICISLGETKHVQNKARHQYTST